MNHNEEFGMNEADFSESQHELSIEKGRYINKEADGPARISFIFENHEQQEKVLKFLSEQGEFYDELRQINTFCTDPYRPNEGIRIDFAKTPENFEQNVIDLFKKQKFNVVKTYLDENFDKTMVEKISALDKKDNIIEMPKKLSKAA